MNINTNIQMIKNRWKTAVTLFAWLMFLLYFFDVGYNYSRLLRVSIEAKILLIIGPLFLVWLFLLSIHKTEEKILDNTFTHWWLIKSYFRVTLSVYVVLVTLITPAIYSVLHDSSFLPAILYYLGNIEFWLIFVPSTTLIVWLLPSLLFYKFYFHKKIVHIFSIISIVTLLIFSSTVITMRSTCSLNSDEYCILDKAIKADNVPLSLCAEMKNVWPKDRCYSAALYYLVGAEDCRKLPRDHQRRVCIFRFAVNAKDFGICDKLEETSSPDSMIARGLCYETIISGGKVAQKPSGVYENKW